MYNNLKIYFYKLFNLKQKKEEKLDIFNFQNLASFLKI